jgi:ABC-type transport system involved in multi-copper enzyme maturation permease subunit
MIKSLFWKEWCEQRWKLVYGCVLSMGFVAVGLRSRIVPDQGIVAMAAVGGAFLMPLLVGMGLVAAERSDGSLGMLLAIPVRPWKIFAVKMMMGTLVCVGPIVGCMALSLAMAAGREMSASRIIVPYLGGVAFSIVMLVWMVAFGIRQPSEARAGLIGIAVFMVWVFIIILSEVFIRPPYHLSRLSLVITPFGIFDGTLDRNYDILPKVISVQLVAGFCLMMWAAYRFGKLGRTKE